MILKISIKPAQPHQQPIECYHPKLSQSIDPSEDGRVRLRSIEFSDNYLHKPAPTDPIIDERSRNVDHLIVIAPQGKFLCG
jgi:hypothetical protein